MKKKSSIFRIAYIEWNEQLYKNPGLSDPEKKALLEKIICKHKIKHEESIRRGKEWKKRNRGKIKQWEIATEKKEDPANSKGGSVRIVSGERVSPR